MTFRNHAFIRSAPLFPERSAKTIEMAGFLCYGKVLLVMINVAVGWSPLQPLKNFTSFYINGRTV